MSSITPERYILALHKTPVILNSLLKGVSQEAAQEATDGPEGWSVLETLCHIRDFTDVSLMRAQLILNEDQPTFPDFDPEEGARARNYKQQELRREFQAFVESRKALLALLTDLTDEQWQRRATHRVYGSLTLLELLVHITWHELNHFEQIARSLKLSEALT